MHSDGLLHVTNMLPHHRQYLGNELVVTASEGEQVSNTSVEREASYTAYLSRSSARF